MKPEMNKIIARAQEMLDAVPTSEQPTEDEEYDLACLFSIVQTLNKMIGPYDTDMITNLAFRAAYNIGRAHSQDTALKNGDDILRKLNGEEQ